MLFSNKKSLFNESEKERNLYYKIFAGIIFNELIQDNYLPEKFLQKLIDKYKLTCQKFEVARDDKDIELLSEMKDDWRNNQLGVTFDYHINQIMKEVDFGELADVLISGTHGFVSIEAKFKTCYQFDKDIRKNQERIIIASEQLKCQGIQVLLIGRKRFENSELQKAKNTSNYNRLYNQIRNNKNTIPFILLYWEDIIDIIPDEPPFDVANIFLKNMITSEY